MKGDCPPTLTIPTWQLLVLEYTGSMCWSIYLCTLVYFQETLHKYVRHCRLCLPLAKSKAQYMLMVSGLKPIAKIWIRNCIYLILSKFRLNQLCSRDEKIDRKLDHVCRQQISCDFEAYPQFLANPACMRGTNCKREWGAVKYFHNSSLLLPLILNLLDMY